MALTAAAQICSGVGKSGSPRLKSKTVLPWARSCRASAPAASVAEGCTFAAMGEMVTGLSPLDIQDLLPGRGRKRQLTQRRRDAELRGGLREGCPFPRPSNPLSRFVFFSAFLRVSAPLREGFSSLLATPRHRTQNEIVCSDPKGIEGTRRSAWPISCSATRRRWVP